MNKRLIYAEDAIDAVAKGLKGVFVEYQDVAEKLLDNVPSVQPEPPEDICGECDAWNKYKSEIKALPSVQPEIIRCKDCKYSDENWRRVSVRWLPCMDMRTGSNWYCGSAERREE